MRILFLVPYMPNPIRVRPFNLIRSLAARGNDLTVATVWTSASERQDVAALEQMGVRVVAVPLPRWRSLWNVALAAPTRAPLQARYCWQPALIEKCRPGLDSFDLIHVEHLRGANYGLALRGRVPVVWDSVDCISHLFEQAVHESKSLFGRLVTRLELGRTRRYEGWLVGQFDHVLVTSSLDREALLRLASRARLERYDSRITVLENGVDLEHFSPAGKAREQTALVFTGKMSYHANVTAALYLVQDIMPHIWRRRPDIQVWLVGQDPPSAVHRLSLDDERIHVTGTVSDLVPYLRRASLAVAPMVYGAGIQNKVLEAMACGTAVVVTSKAVSALDVVDGRHVVVADGAQAFAQAVLRLLDAPARCEQIGLAARQYIEQRHDWRVIAGRLEGVYRDVIHHRHHRTAFK